MLHSSYSHDKRNIQFTFLTIWNARFRKLMFPFIKEPAAKSCANAPIDGLASVMFSLSALIQSNSSLQNDLNVCTWPFHANHESFEKLHNCRPDDSMKLSLCNRGPQPHVACTENSPNSSILIVSEMHALIVEMSLCRNSLCILNAWKWPSTHFGRRLKELEVTLSLSPQK